MTTDYSIRRKGNQAEIFLFPKQQQFIQSDCDEVLYGGSLGGGKSKALLYFALQRRLQHPNTRGLMLRRTFPELQRSLIAESHKIYKMFGAKYNDQKHIWTFPNGSIQEFGHVERESDVYNYQSAEYQDICFDEATHFSEFIIRYLMSRCRSSIPGVKTLIRYASNPGGPGHSFFKKRFIDPWEKEKIWIDQETGKRLTFIPAKLWDNPALTENNPDYVKSLKALPEKKRLSLVEGRWDVFEGQFFSEWNESLHVLRKNHTPAPNTQKIIAEDWGYASPACVLWGEITPIGRIYIYREHYVTQRAPKFLAQDVMDLTPTEEEGFRGVILPPEIFGKKVELEEGGVPIADLQSEVLSIRFGIQKANNARIAGWAKVREYLSLAPDGLPWLQISPACKNLIRTLPAMVFDTTKDMIQEDLDTTAEDHAVDCLRYLCMALNTVPKNILSPHGTMSQIFGTREQRVLASSPTIPGRGGY